MMTTLFDPCCEFCTMTWIWWIAKTRSSHFHHNCLELLNTLTHQLKFLRTFVFSVMCFLSRWFQRIFIFQMRIQKITVNDDDIGEGGDIRDDDGVMMMIWFSLLSPWKVYICWAWAINRKSFWSQFQILSNFNGFPLKGLQQGFPQESNCQTAPLLASIGLKSHTYTITSQQRRCIDSK